MTDLLDPARIELVLLLVVPGFVSLKTWRVINPAERSKMSDHLLDLIVFSLVNYVLLFWLVDMANDSASNLFGVIVHLLTLLGFPILWPILLRALLTSNLLRGRVIHPTPTSWDFFFGLGKPCFVLIHLKNGRLIGGMYSTESFASSYPEPHDLYLQEVWKITSDGKFERRIDQTSGLLIS